MPKKHRPACKYCGTQVKRPSRIYCSNLCQAKYQRDSKERKLIEAGFSLVKGYCIYHPEIKLTSYGQRLRCRICETDKTHHYRNKKKQFAVAYLGGKCEKCGYEKCISALEFHHRNKDEKDFMISKYLKCKEELLKKELDKCMLLCANCHREEHYATSIS